MDRLLLHLSRLRMSPRAWDARDAVVATSPGMVADVLHQWGPSPYHWPGWVDYVPLPEGPGLWVAEGAFPDHIDKPSWRRPTAYELEAFSQGRDPWPPHLAVVGGKDVGNVAAPPVGRAAAIELVQMFQRVVARPAGAYHDDDVELARALLVEHGTQAWSFVNRALELRRRAGQGVPTQLRFLTHHLIVVGARVETVSAGDELPEPA